ncbi:MAG: HNH endonuclease signature motif containing protein [Chloroflexota bacterium]
MSVYIPVSLRQRIRNRFGNCCAYCRTAESLTVAIFEFEHILPLSLGGLTEYANLCFSCPTCNRYKASRQYAIEPVSGYKFPLFHPQEQRWADHFAWNEPSTKIIGLTSIGKTTLEALRMNRPQLIRVRRMWVTLEEHPPHFD